MKKKLVGFGAKLVPTQVRWARKAYTKGQLTQIQIADVLKITQAAVSLMLRRKTYQRI